MISGTEGLIAAPGLRRDPWIDRRLAEIPPKPWRKIHLDFHNTPFVGEVGHGFRADEFVELLRVGHVDSIVLFAKDMHGYFYFPSRRGPVHPGLTRDLLGEQVAACRSAGIAAYGYYCVTWDNVMAEEHPEWLVVRRDRTTYLPRFDETPAWTALCLSNRPFVDTVVQDSREILGAYDLDGIWYDMPLPIGGECYCRNCLAELRGVGKEPFDLGTQRAHKQQLLVGFLREARQVAHEVRPGCQIDQNNQSRLGLGERIEYFDNVDIEALPTGGWGYQYFPVDVRYARTFGRSVYGQTGRFHQSWGDFGGLKHPRQLAVEVAAIVAQGAHCCIGDQAPPSAQLDRATYETIGKAYAQIERLEDVLEGAVPVVEAAMLVDGQPLVDPGTVSTGPASPDTVAGVIEGVGGLAELLVHHRVQFDIVEPSAEIDVYRLLVVPDGLQVSAEVAHKLCGFVERGGALLAFAGSASVAGTDELWLPGMSVDVEGRSPFVPAYLVAAPPLSVSLTNFEYALYAGSYNWRVHGDGAEVWARLGVPAFQRSPEHYTSHAQSPFLRTTDLGTVVRTGRVGATAFDLGTAYHRTGYWPYRVIFGALLDAVLPERLVRSEAPATVEITLTYQRSNGSKRWLVHVVNATAGRRWGPRLERFEDPIMLRGLRVTVEVPDRVARAWQGGAGNDVAFRQLTEKSGRSLVEIEVPPLDTSCVVVLECG